MSKKLVIISASVAVLIIALGAVVWWLFASGRLVYISSGSSQKSYGVVCDSDVVAKYNDAVYYKIRDNPTQGSIDNAGLDNLVKDIKSTSGYEKDPTCQDILFLYAVKNDDFKSANSAYESIKALHSERAFYDPNIRSSEPLFMYEDIIKGLTGSGFSENNASGN